MKITIPINEVIKVKLEVDGVNNFSLDSYNEELNIYLRSCLETLMEPLSSMEKSDIITLIQDFAKEYYNEN